MRTAIMTDTNSGISVEEGLQQGIFVLPMPVIVDGQDYLEGVNITHSQLYEAILAGREVSSSQPSPGNISDMWDKILSQGYDEIVYQPMSSGLSSSCSSAIALAEDYHGKVSVADNHRISVTLQASVLEAKQMADEGLDSGVILRHLNATAYDSSIYISVNSLELLKKSGRVTPAAAAIATVIHLKPVLTIQGGKLDTFSKARGMKSSEKKMVEAIHQDIVTRFPDIPKERLIIGAAGTFSQKEDAQSWLATVQETFPGHPTFYRDLSCSIACHVSVDAAGIGVSLLRKPLTNSI